MLLTKLILLQIIISSLLHSQSVTNMNIRYSEIAAFYNKYLIYAIGITKYASNTLTLDEFPIKIKASLLYQPYYIG